MNEFFLNPPFNSEGKIEVACNRIILSTPLSAEAINSLRAGDIVELSGEIITARDAAHKRIETALRESASGSAQGTFCPRLLSEQGVHLNQKVIFYAGPCPAQPGKIIGSIAPTTSERMDIFLETVYRLGVSATIGKGGRGALAARLCAKYKKIYFLSYGGAGALISKQVTQCVPLAYEDLGAESIKSLHIENMRLIVGIDSRGCVFDTEQIAKYKKEE
ncbi:MAG: fumarate hydratase C-terminal domain-containing protein [Spirochaetaceae bacterium]|jgi:fumarate hydratase subunit beta|nr:fumarate hydratase C-terminal domain-containing protein [Spirochaetaceae bacterium]